GELDTAHPTGSTDLVLKTGEPVPLAGRSVVILRKTA
ncbi:MAG: hypothetical protein QOK33_755, partial [Mycobacterium sp.]|nr:hypothetical protein [Mycobacterium sp.]